MTVIIRISIEIFYVGSVEIQLGRVWPQVIPDEYFLITAKGKPQQGLAADPNEFPSDFQQLLLLYKRREHCSYFPYSARVVSRRSSVCIGDRGCASGRGRDLTLTSTLTLTWGRSHGRQSLAFQSDGWRGCSERCNKLSTWPITWPTRVIATCCWMLAF